MRVLAEYIENRWPKRPRRRYVLTEDMLSIQVWRLLGPRVERKCPLVGLDPDYVTTETKGRMLGLFLAFFLIYVVLMPLLALASALGPVFWTGFGIVTVGLIHTVLFSRRPVGWVRFFGPSGGVVLYHDGRQKNEFEAFLSKLVAQLRERGAERAPQPR